MSLASHQTIIWFCNLRKSIGAIAPSCRVLKNIKKQSKHLQEVFGVACSLGWHYHWMLGLFAKAPARTPHTWKFLNGFEQPCHWQIMLAFGDLLTENPFCLGAALCCTQKSEDCTKWPESRDHTDATRASRPSTRGLCIAVSPLSICDMSKSPSPWKMTAAVRPAWSQHNNLKIPFQLYWIQLDS